MTAQSPIIFPFGDEITYRHAGEKINDEAYRGIPALNALVTSTLVVSNKITQDARDALLLQDGKIDPSLRVAKVEVGMVKRHAMENAQPDLEYLSGLSAASRRDFETPDNDIWFSPQ